MITMETYFSSMAFCHLTCGDENLASACMGGVGFLRDAGWIKESFRGALWGLSSGNFTMQDVVYKHMLRGEVLIRDTRTRLAVGRGKGDEEVKISNYTGKCIGRASTYFDI